MALIGLCTLMSTNLLAQKADKALARVNYKFTHVEDTNKRDQPHTETMLLVVGNNASVYTSLDKINRNKQIQASLQEQMKEQAGSSNFKFNISNTGTKPTTNIDIYNFSNEKILYVSETLINSYLVEDKAAQIDWKISKDTASFKGIKCQKATANFKGRSWTAWFAADYPMSAGPWKLQGLPGLILQAQDSKNEVKFEFESLEFVRPQEKSQEAAEANVNNPGRSLIMVNGSDAYFGSEIMLPAKATIISQKELDKLKEIRAKDPEGFQRSQLAGMGVTQGFKAGNSNSGSEVKSISINASGQNSNKSTRIINNPIELSNR